MKSGTKRRCAQASGAGRRGGSAAGGVGRRKGAGFTEPGEGGWLFWIATESDGRRGTSGTNAVSSSTSQQLSNEPQQPRVR